MGKICTELKDLQVNPLKQQDVKNLLNASKPFPVHLRGSFLLFVTRWHEELYFTSISYRFSQQ